MEEIKFYYKNQSAPIRFVHHVSIDQFLDVFGVTDGGMLCNIVFRLDNETISNYHMIYDHAKSDAFWCSMRDKLSMLWSKHRSVQILKVFITDL